MPHAEIIFESAWWKSICVLHDGSCDPPPKTRCRDRLRVESSFHLGSQVYSVANMSKGYQCFVQIGYRSEGYGKGPLARCNHPDCIKWQHTHIGQRSPCKHIRAVCLWHVKFTRRAKRLAESAEIGAI